MDQLKCAFVAADFKANRCRYKERCKFSTLCKYRHDTDKFESFETPHGIKVAIVLVEDGTRYVCIQNKWYEYDEAIIEGMRSGTAPRPSDEDKASHDISTTRAITTAHLSNEKTVRRSRSQASQDVRLSPEYTIWKSTQFDLPYMQVRAAQLPPQVPSHTAPQGVLSFTAETLQRPAQPLRFTELAPQSALPCTSETLQRPAPPLPFTELAQKSTDGHIALHNQKVQLLLPTHQVQQVSPQLRKAIFHATFEDYTRLPCASPTTAQSKGPTPLTVRQHLAYCGVLDLSDKSAMCRYDVDTVVSGCQVNSFPADKEGIRKLAVWFHHDSRHYYIADVAQNPMCLKTLAHVTGVKPGTYVIVRFAPLPSTHRRLIGIECKDAEVIELTEVDMQYLGITSEFERRGVFPLASKRVWLDVVNSAKDYTIVFGTEHYDLLEALDWSSRLTTKAYVDIYMGITAKTARVIYDWASRDPARRAQVKAAIELKCMAFLDF